MYLSFTGKPLHKNEASGTSVPRAFYKIQVKDTLKQNRDIHKKDQPNTTPLW